MKILTAAATPVGLMSDDVSRQRAGAAQPTRRPAKPGSPQPRLTGLNYAHEQGIVAIPFPFSQRPQMPENSLLIKARLALPSPADPSKPMNRQELAEALDIWIHTKTGKNTSITANYIGKLERGAILWPMGIYREACRAVLQAESDQDLGFVETDGHSRSLLSGKSATRSKPGPKPAAAQPSTRSALIASANRLLMEGDPERQPLEVAMQIPATQLMITAGAGRIGFGDKCAVALWIALPADSAHEREMARQHLTKAAMLLTWVSEKLIPKPQPAPATTSGSGAGAQKPTASTSAVIGNGGQQDR